jgi:hypothetical protein
VDTASAAQLHLTQSMDEAKLDQYRRAIQELQEAAKHLRRGSPDWDVEFENYRKAKERWEKARAEFLDPTSGASAASDQGEP